MARRVQVFLVAVESSDMLEDKVVSNYVDMAIKKFAKAAYKLEQTSYFDGVSPGPNFSVKEIQSARFPQENFDPMNAIRDSIAVAKEVRERLNASWSPIEDPDRYYS